MRRVVFGDLLCRATGRLWCRLGGVGDRRPALRRDVRPERRSVRLDADRRHRTDRDRHASRCRSTTPIRRRATFELNVARHLARSRSERIGSLLVNPGGPGFGGTDFALHADQIYGQALLDHFDIVGWDPRGTGASEPAIDCIDDYDHFFATGDITPDDAAERQQLVDLAKEFATDCVDKNAAYIQYVGTNNSARDMDAIRAALGEEKISYFGFSYGSELGATWATLFPTTVRAAVLDGAVDPPPMPPKSGARADQGLRGLADDVPRRSAVPTPSARSTTAATPGVPSTG